MGTIPGPIFFGYIIDQVCLLKDGNCLFYDNYSMAISMGNLIFLWKLLKILLIFLMICNFFFSYCHSYCQNSCSRVLCACLLFQRKIANSRWKRWSRCYTLIMFWYYFRFCDDYFFIYFPTFWFLAMFYMLYITTHIRLYKLGWNWMNILHVQN